MQFIDLKEQYRRIKHSINKNIDTVLSHGEFILGPEVFELEAKLADYTGAKYCVSCSSGTDALLMTLLAFDIGPGDAVLTTPFTFAATAEMIVLLGATPVFVDVDPETFNISPTRLNETIYRFKAGSLPVPKKFNELTLKAIIAVDLFGLPADYDSIFSIARENNLIVIADAAQSFGAKYKEKFSGNCADCTTTSFFPAKPLGCYGDGGAIFTNDEKVHETLVSIRVHGKGTNKYDNIRTGINGRLDTIQAAILLSKLSVFPDEIQQRQIIAQRYSEMLQNTVHVPSIPEGYRSAWAHYSVTSDNRDERLQALRAENIPTAVYYSRPLHLQTAFSYLGYRCGDMPVSEHLAETIFSLPMHPYLNEGDQEKIVKCLIKIK